MHLSVGHRLAIFFLYPVRSDRCADTGVTLHSIRGERLLEGFRGGIGQISDSGSCH